MARHDSIHRYPRRRVPAELPFAKASLGQDAVRQRLYLGTGGLMFSRFDQLCVSYGCQISAWFLRELCAAGDDVAVSVQESFLIWNLLIVSSTSMWYTREEQSLLNSLWYCMSGVQLMVSRSITSARCLLMFV